MRRRTLLLGAVGALLAGQARASAALTPDDMALGREDAPVTLIEYASLTCPACAAFHAAAWEGLSALYVEAGLVRFVFREFPTPPEALALAGFQIARCRNATPEQYMARIGELLRQQQTILGAADMAGARRRLGVIAQGFGLTTAEINAAIDDPAGAERARRLHQSAQAFNIASTPSFVINGQRYQGPLSPRALAQALNAAGAAP